MNFCTFFTDTTCIVDRAELSTYNTLSLSELSVQRADSASLYDFHTNRDTLFLRKNSKQQFERYVKAKPLSSLSIREMYFSQDDGLSEFDCLFSEDGTILLDIAFHPSFKPGKYIARTSDDFKLFINTLTSQMSYNISSDLKQSIVSDIQEWAAIITLANGEQHKLYHNYSAMDESHIRYANMMSFLPLMLKLQPTDFKDELEVVSSYRFREFERNMEETNR